MTHKKKSSFISKRSRSLVLIVIFCVIGVGLLITSRAAVSVVSYEPENGNKVGNMAIKSDQTASANQAIHFGSINPNILPLGLNQTNGPSGNWSLKLNDEFEGTTLNSSNWSTGWFGSGITSPVQNQELVCYDPAQVSVGEGVLKLKIIASQVNCAKGINPHPYRSGAITSMNKKLYSYGYFEAKILLDTDANGNIYNWPAWWMDGTGDWPATGELDVMEGLGGTATATWHGPENDGAGKKFGDVAITPGWHTFAAEWEPGRVTSYYDGIKRGTYASSTNITSDVQFMALMAQVDEIGGHGGDLKVPSEMVVDYVRVWQR